jgi:hypothetical protein
MENHPEPRRERVTDPRSGGAHERMGVDDVVAHDGTSWLPPRWLTLTLLVALVVGGAVGYADHRARTREAAAVAACERSLRVASAQSEGRMGLLVNYVQPARRTAEGVQQLHLADLMAERAGRVLPAVQHADRVCRAVAVRPWHFSLVARRDAARAYSGALVTLLQTVAAQGRRPFHDDATLLRLRVGAGVG